MSNGFLIFDVLRVPFFQFLQFFSIFCVFLIHFHFIIMFNASFSFCWKFQLETPFYHIFFWNIISTNLGVAAVAGVFLLLGLGMVMGVVILIFEHWFYKYALPSLRLKPKGLYQQIQFCKWLVNFREYSNIRYHLEIAEHYVF